MFGGRRPSEQAQRGFEADRELAGRLPELLRAASEAEAALRAAQERGAEAEELRPLGLALDGALTDAVRAAYAAQRVAVGARGRDDRVYRRRRLARPEVKELTLRAERLLTMREAHRLHGIARVSPRVPV
ncbi:hypothetical protein CLV72_104349 [Allonocardiopsis opalescens]|uniref:Uncharacterized protein n=2 Tax=Allonocardiopsis opalescens TaxID=1144618 RepID=A0A2T0Q4U6_9ACTN|nr:hypothetical protein [Allonocardiopsis opalescens]PRX98769.1 hypothetical protein CLV72_104349 [Allonocardiopsis opalescens]